MRSLYAAGAPIAVTLPRSGNAVLTALDASAACASARLRPDTARAHRWKRMLEQRTCRSAGEIAEGERITRSFINRLLRLTLLAPGMDQQTKADFASV